MYSRVQESGGHLRSLPATVTQQKQRGTSPQVEGKSVWKAEGRKEHGWRPPVAVGQERDTAVAGPRGSVVRVQGQPSCG